MGAAGSQGPLTSGEGTGGEWADSATWNVLLNLLLQCAVAFIEGALGTSSCLGVRKGVHRRAS